MIFIVDFWFYVVVILVLFFVGLFKGGFGGIFVMFGVLIMFFVILFL